MTSAEKRIVRADHFMHDMARLWLDDLIRDAALPTSRKQLKDDLAITRKWLQVERAENIGPTHYEQWARAFEQYLAAGSAPTASLDSAFEYYSKRALTDSRSPISDEIRGVFDRLLATDAQLHAVRRESTHWTRPKRALVRGALFFMIAFALAVLLEVLLLLILGEMSSSRVLPRGLGWVVIPIIAGLLGWLFGSKR
jgi:hypothetical protein